MHSCTPAVLLICDGMRWVCGADCVLRLRWIAERPENLHERPDGVTPRDVAGLLVLRSLAHCGTLPRALRDIQYASGEFCKIIESGSIPFFLSLILTAASPRLSCAAIS